MQEDVGSVHRGVQGGWKWLFMQLSLLPALVVVNAIVVLVTVTVIFTAAVVSPTPTVTNRSVTSHHHWWTVEPQWMSLRCNILS